MKGYVIVVYRKVADDETMQAYAKLALPALMALAFRSVHLEAVSMRASLA